ncbi:related to Pdp3-interacting factor 1 [Saccharomycodes ludwigii]|uniref:Related to Pdp3-interacting factor 1 n=1 Tax=Saccharomycodes ludwigii TaxID=36035 RepID=A0A376B1K2_9ASCO|nr:hypothetical protein SCDLUD_003472 [Saccharomycodes ludwigii]KAH3900487.1 hypothetical protein SCDLUD_003472 [Saccharomycodes ludwigii]SSD58547.1 related to Pdp3-interacting factor 1 [Saccharomycodes ludwigii]
MSSSAKQYKAVIFSDFDGTITLQDSNDYLTDKYGFGKEERLEIFKGVLDGSKSFKEGFTQMLDSIKLPLNECIDILINHIQLDPGFIELYKYCQKEDIPLVIISSGMKPLIRAVLNNLFTKSNVTPNIEIVSNDVVEDASHSKNGYWHIIFKDVDSPHGHDKSRSIDELKLKYPVTPNGKGKYFYCGDGVSDLSAAKECDVLFARSGKDLITYCDKLNIPYVKFNSFEDIMNEVKKELS